MRALTGIHSKLSNEEDTSLTLMSPRFGNLLRIQKMEENLGGTLKEWGDEFSALRKGLRIFIQRLRIFQNSGKHLNLESNAR